MLKIKLTLITILIYASFNNVSSEIIQNKIIANIGNEIISSYELKNKIKTILFLNNQKIDQNIVNKTKGQALRQLINYKLKKQEVEKFEIKSNEENVLNHLDKIATTFNSSREELKKIFRNNNIDYNLYYRETDIEYKWQSLIYTKYRNQISIDENEISEELSEILKKKSSVVEYKLAEIEIILDNEQSIDDKTKEIFDLINKDGFKNTAIKISQSTSSQNGGEIGWIQDRSLSRNILNVIKDMKPGAVSKPIKQDNSLIFLKLLDIRSTSAKDLNIEKIKNTIRAKKRNEYFNLFSNSYLSKLKNNTFIQIK
tara:strand:- start:123 stop:1061 length:939 start_codon:yes stop_codon:yes gene_type:complete